MGSQVSQNCLPIWRVQDHPGQHRRLNDDHDRQCCHQRGQKPRSPGRHSRPVNSTIRVRPTSNVASSVGDGPVCQYASRLRLYAKTPPALKAHLHYPRRFSTLAWTERQCDVLGEFVACRPRLRCYPGDDQRRRREAFSYAVSALPFSSAMRARQRSATRSRTQWARAVSHSRSPKEASYWSL